jgi:UDP-N-acetylglucosamine acyltransferase
MSVTDIRARTGFVHETAVVEAGAELHESVVVGPMCFVGSGVRLGPGTELVAHATVLGPSEFGSNNKIYPYATLGADPQDRSYRGEPTRLVVGEGCIFREQVTVHRGTQKGGGVTRIGDRCLLMVGAHVAHDCALGDDVVLTNLTTLGGHVEVGRGVVCGGHVAVAPYVRLGDYSFIAGGARVERDAPPYMILQGDRARVRGVNRVGLERGGIPATSRDALLRAYKLIYLRAPTVADGVVQARKELAGEPCVERLIAALSRACG